MNISIITLFPEMFSHIFNDSIIKRAQQEKKVILNTINLRDFGIGNHKQVDDTVYGGGVGMVLRVDVVDKAIKFATSGHKDSLILLMDPTGTPYKQELAEKFSLREHIVIICGHYEGYDERIRSLVDQEISLGDFVLSGGEIPAMAIVESVTRLIPGVLKHPEATQLESFSKRNDKRILEYPQYTRPEKYETMSVPKVLLSGNHASIENFRKEKGTLTTKSKRPDLL